MLLVLPSLAAALLAPYQQIKAARALDPASRTEVSPLDGVSGRALVVLLPQLGEFDSAEMVEQLVAVESDCVAAGLDMR
eukprot:2434810-Prymnesium_polylepis.1